MRRGTRRGGARPGLAGRAYRAILLLYPRDFRADYAAEAAELFDRLHDERREAEGGAAARRFAARSLGRALGGAALERLGVPGRSRRARHDSKTGWRSMRHDIRYAVRALVKRPGFAATVILLLATGIGAATAVFSVVDAVLLRSLPYPDPDRLVYLDNGSHSTLDIQDWQREVESIDTWGGTWNEQSDLTGDGSPERVGVGRVTEELFPLLGARATLGRLFSAGDHVGDPAVAIVSHRFWTDRWGADPEVLGRDIRVGDRTLTVVGVMAPGFVMPSAMDRWGTQLWIPQDLRQPSLQDRGTHVIQLIGRLAPDVSLDRAQAEMQAVNERFAERFPDTHLNRDGTVATTPVVPLHEAEVGGVEGTLVMLLGAVGLLLLLACANVANLLLACGADRRREVALRGALGATRRNVFAQLTAESLILSVAGGVAGVALAFLGVRLFILLEPGVIPRTEGLAVDLRVLGFATLVSLVTGLIFGIVPASRAAGVDANSALKEGSGQATVGRRRARLQNSLVVSEVALSLILLTGAGLLFHSFVNLTGVDPGFEESNLVTVSLELAEPYDATLRGQFLENLLPRLRALPGTNAVVAGVTLPFQYASGGSCCWRSSVTIAGEPEDTGVRTDMYPVTPGYVSALEIPLAAGRDLRPGDGDLQPLPVVIGEHAAESLFGEEEEALGATLAIGERRALVVGVARDVRQVSFELVSRPNMYLPWEAAGRDMSMLNLAIRTELEAAALAPAIRAAVWDLDPNLTVPDIVTMEGRMARSVADERFYSAVLAAFAVIALLLAAGGVYATFLYTVRQRVREMGIRLALGARSADVVRLILRRGFLLTAAGIAVGLLAAAAGARVLGSMVFGISPHDPLTYVVVAGLMTAVALGACLLPALRAGRTDPMETLRTE